MLDAYFGTEVSYENVHVVFRKCIEYMFQFLVEAVFHVINFMLCWGMHVQNNTTPATSQYYV
jgi:hypothetical protein